jgi:hypothetical protein
LYVLSRKLISSNTLTFLFNLTSHAKKIKKKCGVSHLTATAKNLSPIPGSKYVHQCDETKRKREIELSNNTSLSPGEEMIVRHVKAIKHNNKMVDVTPAAK